MKMKRDLLEYIFVCVDTTISKSTNAGNLKARALKKICKEIDKQIAEAEVPKKE